MFSFEDSAFELILVLAVFLYLIALSLLIFFSLVAVHGLKNGPQTITNAGKALAILIIIMFAVWGGIEVISAALLVFIPFTFMIWNWRYWTPLRTLKLCLSVFAASVAFLLMWVLLTFILLLIPQEFTPFGRIFDVTLVITLLIALAIIAVFYRSSLVNHTASTMRNKLFNYT